MPAKTAEVENSDLTTISEVMLMVQVFASLTLSLSLP